LTGLFYGGGLAVLKAQAIGSAIVCSATFASAMIMFKALDAFKLLRVTVDDETEGLDVSQHGNTAYPEHVVAGLNAAPDGSS
jgi:Amt family ammonium transporter